MIAKSGASLKTQGCRRHGEQARAPVAEHTRSYLTGPFNVFYAGGFGSSVTPVWRRPSQRNTG